MRKIALVLAASVAALAACSSRDASKGGDNGAHGGTIIFASLGDVIEPFPALTADEKGTMMADLVFDRLAMLGPKLSAIGDKDFEPRLAQSWDWAKDSLSIAFHINPKARWHDGKPVTASDVKYSFKVYSDPKTGSPAGSLLGNIDSVQVRDSLTPVVWYKKRDPYQFFNFTYQIWILPEHVYGAIPDDQLQTSPVVKQQIIGSGRYRVGQWQPGVRLDFVADTANYRGRPSFDHFVLTPISDPNAGATQVLTGQADFMVAYPIDQIATLDSSPTARLIDLPTLGYSWLGFNHMARKAKSGAHPIFGDVRVRRALSMAVDRKAMLENVFGSKGRLGIGPFPAVLSYADSNLKLPPYDTTAAKALLDSAGWRMGPNGVRMKNGAPLKFALTSVSTSLPRRRYSVLLQEAFKRIGAQADIDAVDPPTFMRGRMLNGDFDAILGSFNPDPDVGGARQSWSTSAIGTTNWLRYSNKQVDVLLDSAALAFDPAKSKSLSSRAFQMVADDAPAIWLYDVLQFAGAHRRIQIPEPTRADAWWRSIDQWSIPAGKRIDRDKIGVTQPKP